MTTKTRGNPTTTLNARGLRIAIVVSNYNRAVTDRLLRGAQDCLEKHGAVSSHTSVYSCPGAFELPQVAGALSRRQRWDAIICLGAVIRGETPHFDFVAAAAARGIESVALSAGIPVLFGVLTTENVRQALDRSGGGRGNKGWEAALAAIEMARLFQNLKRKRKHQTV